MGKETFSNKISIEEIEKLWLSDAMHVYSKQFKKGVLNILNSPAGSGKSTFVFEGLLQNHQEYGIEKLRLNKIIYVCDTGSLVSRIIKTKSKLVKEYKSGNLDRISYKNPIGYMNKILVMTYAMLGTLLKSQNNRNKIYECDAILFDEIHQVPRYSYKFDEESDNNTRDGVYKNVLKYIPEMTRQCYCIGLSATMYGNIIYRLEENNIKCNIIFNANEIKTIRSYNFNPKYTNYSFNVIKEYALRKDIFENGEKLLIYTNTIKSSEKYKQHFIKLGINAEWLCSNKALNKDTSTLKMNDYQLNLRQNLLDNGEVDSNIQCLIINAAYETGIDIYDKYMEFQHVIIDAIDETTQVQARNRIRHDIKELYVLLSKFDIGYDEIYEHYCKVERGEFKEYLGLGDYLYEVDLTKYIDDKFINVKLTKELKNEMVEKYAIKEVGKENREFTFASIKKSIENNISKFKLYIDKSRNQGMWLFRSKEIVTYLKENKLTYSDEVLDEYFKSINNEDSKDAIKYLEEIADIPLNRYVKVDLAKVINCKKNGKLQTGIKAINEKLMTLNFEIVEGGTDWKRTLLNGDKNKNYGKKYYIIRKLVS